MVSALTPEQQFIAQFIDQMNAELAFLEEGFSGNDHQKELDEKMAQDQRRFDAAAEGSRKACLETQQSVDDLAGSLISSLASEDITSANGKQIANLQRTVSELKGCKDELLRQYRQGEYLLRSLIKQQTEMQRSLVELHVKIRADHPTISFPPFSGSDGGGGAKTARIISEKQNSSRI